jgi:hypothetical protein
MFVVPKGPGLQPVWAVAAWLAKGMADPARAGAKRGAKRGMMGEASGPGPGKPSTRETRDDRAHASPLECLRFSHNNQLC